MLCFTHEKDGNVLYVSSCRVYKLSDIPPNLAMKDVELQFSLWDFVLGIVIPVVLFTVGCEILNMPGIVLCSPTVVVPWFLTALSIALFLSNMPLCHSPLFCLCFLSSALHPSRTTSVARYYKRPASGPIVCVCARARRRARVYLSL